MGHEEFSDAMVVVATFVSRFEAITCASMLRAHGYHVIVDGEHHASVEYISLALGGHRLRVFHSEWQGVSDLLREIGLPEQNYVPFGPTRALLWLIGSFATIYAVLLGIMISAGVSMWSALLHPIAVLSIPVDPKGSADYYLAACAKS